MEDITKGLPTDVLKLIYNSKFEIVIILNNGAIIEANNEENLKQYEEAENLSYIFFKSDFETIYAIKNELKARKKQLK